MSVTNSISQDMGYLKISKVFDPLTSGFTGTFRSATIARWWLTMGPSACSRWIDDDQRDPYRDNLHRQRTGSADPTGRLELWHTFDQPGATGAINSTTTPVEVTVTNSITPRPGLPEDQQGL